MRALSLFAISCVCFAQSSSRAEESGWKETRAILNKAKSFELFSLNPNPLGSKKEYRAFVFVVRFVFGHTEFQKWDVMGRTTVSDERTKTKLLAALDKGIQEWDDKTKKERESGLLTATGCFQPRHGIRAALDGKTTDLLICFECHPIHFFLNGKEGLTFTSAAPQEVFDEVLKKAGVPISERLFKDNTKPTAREQPHSLHFRR